MNNYTPPLADQSNATLKSGYTVPVSPYNALVKTTTDVVVLKGNYTAPQSPYDVALKGPKNSGTSKVFFTGDVYSQFGNAEVISKAQLVRLSGFDSFSIGHSLSEFNTRMRVIQVDPLRQTISTFGNDCFATGIAAIKNKRHYISPDGNSDMYRQGIPKWISN